MIIAILLKYAIQLDDMYEFIKTSSFRKTINKMKLLLLPVLSSLAACSTVNEEQVKHATVADPAHYKIEFENDYVKV